MDKDDWLWIVGCLIWLAIGIALALLFGITLQVECTRVEPTQVNCRLQKRWLTLLPLSDSYAITQLQQATATTTCNYNDDCSTTLELVGRSATLSVPPVGMTAALGKAAEIRIREFIAAEDLVLKAQLVDWWQLLPGLPSAIGFFILPASIRLYHQFADAVRFVRSQKRTQQAR